MKVTFLAVGEAGIASPEELASQGEAIVLALPLKASLRRALSLKETEIASLLAPSGASFLASRLRSLVLNSDLVLALRLRTFLALSAGSGSEAASKCYHHIERCFGFSLA